MEGYYTSAEGASIARRRKLLEALQTQSMETPIVGNTGGMQAGLKVLTAALNAKAGKKLDAEDKAGRATYGTELGQETNDYLSRMQGTPGQTMSPEQVQALMMNDQAPQLADPIAANPREAVIRAMTSQKPEMQALGQAGMAELAKAKPAGMSMADFLKLSGGEGGYSAKSRILAALANDPSLLQPGQGMHPVNGQLVQTQEGQAPVVQGDFRDQYGPVGAVATGPEGKPIIGQMNTSTGKASFAPGGGTTVNVGDDKKDAVLLTRANDVLKESSGKIEAASRLYQKSEDIYALANDPSVQTGFAADELTTLGAMATKLKLMDGNGVAKTETLKGELSALALDAMQKLKGNASDKDILFLKEASLGSIKFTAAAIRRVAGLSMQAAHNTILNASTQYESASKVPGGDRLAPLYPIAPWSHKIPENDEFQIDDKTNQVRYVSPLTQGGGKAPAAAPGSVMSYEEYMKRQGVK